MIRWIKQRDSFSCVPIAFMNLNKWLGHQITYKDLCKFREVCGTTQEEGSSHEFYDKAIKKMRKQIVIRRRNNIRFEEIRKAIESGGLILMGSAWDSDSQIYRHMFTVTNCRKNELFCVNVGGFHDWFDDDDFNHYFMKTWKHYPWAYIIRRR